MLDTQKERLYDFEAEWFDWNRKTCSIKEVRQLVKWACRKYKLKPPRVQGHSDGRYATYYPDGCLISFPKFHRNRAVALHEAAHHIIFSLLGETVQDHGGTFTGVYFWLLVEAAVAPREAVEASAKAAGLRWLRQEEAAPVRFLRRAAKSVLAT